MPTANQTVRQATAARRQLKKLLKQLPSLRLSIYKLLVAIKKDQCWEPSPDAEEPYIDFTIGCTFSFTDGEIAWGFRTGDNSFTGGAYGHREWFTTSILRRSSCMDLATDLISEIDSRICELASGHFPFAEY